MNKITFATLAASALIGVGLMGCSRKSDSSVNPSPPPKAQQATTPETAPIIQSVLTVWKQGDKSAAVSRFLETDWSARPLFTPGSTMSLSEDQFKALPLADSDTKSRAMMPELRALKELAAAVAQAGRDAAAKKNSAQARKHFTSLEQCGEALESSDTLLIVKLVGKGLKKMADTELAKLGQ